MTESTDRLSAALADRYKILSRLGEGGMATVWLGEDLRHNRNVAIKVLRPDIGMALGPDRFLREIEIAAQLHHPHILPLFDSGEAGGLLFYVMPVVKGESLRTRIDREKQLPVDDVIQISCDVAEALDYAHSHGIVHRDIKPENIMLSSGHALVADFGIARALSDSEKTQLTETGVSIGTPAYMSPEQASGDPVLDGRSDIYSLGCVIYEMLTGEPPHTGLSARAIIAKKLTSPPADASVIRETVPPYLDFAIGRALARTPADRFSSAKELVDVLRQKSPARGSKKQSRQITVRLPVVVATLVLMTLAAFLLMMQARQPGAAVDPRSKQLTFTGAADDVSLAPDGNTVAYTTNSGQLIVVDALAGGGELVRVNADARSPLWSPDGSEILYQGVRDTLYRVPRMSGQPRRLGRYPQSAYALASDSRLVIGRSNWIYVGNDLNNYDPSVWPPPSGASGDLFQLPDTVRIRPGAERVSMSPDAKWIAFIAQVRSSGGYIGIVDTRSGDHTILSSGKAMLIGDGARVSWSPSSDAVYFRASPGDANGNSIWRIGINEDSGEPDRRGDSQVYSDHVVANYDLSEDLTKLAVVAGASVLNVFIGELNTLNPSPMRPMTTGTAWTISGDFSNDGTRLVYSQFSGLHSPAKFVKTRNVEGEPAEETYPLDDLPCCMSWSPDDTRIAMYLLDSTGTVARLAILDTRTDELRTYNTGAWLSRTRWTPDGASVVHLSEDRFSIVSTNAESGDTRVIQRFNEQVGRESISLAPDGSAVAFTGGGGSELGTALWTISLAPPSSPRRVIDRAFPVEWTSEGILAVIGADSLVRVSPRGDRMELVAKSVDFGVCGGSLAISPSERFYMCSKENSIMDVWYIEDWSFK